jgi:hypothetical protein
MCLMSLPDIDNMTREELEQAKREVAEARARYAAETGKTVDEILSNPPTAPDVVPVAVDPTKADEEEKPAPWPHQTLEFRGQVLEVRKPNQEALVAVTVAGVGVLDQRSQMQIFSTFLSRHMSPASMIWALTAMTDPENPVGIAELIQALAKLASSE